MRQVHLQAGPLRLVLLLARTALTGLGMNIAMAVRKNANCLGRKVSTVIVKGNRITSTWYNGTPEGNDNVLMEDVSGVVIRKLTSQVMDTTFVYACMQSRMLS